MKPGPPGRLPVGGQQAADDDLAPRRRPGQLEEAWPGGGRGHRVRIVLLVGPGTPIADDCAAAEADGDAASGDES